MFSSRLPFEWIVAIRFLREGRLQTAFIIAGVAIGVAVIVFMSALMAGLQSNFIQRVLSASAHIELLPPKQVSRPLRNGSAASASEVEAAIVQAPLQRLKSIDQWQAVSAQIQAMPAVMVVAPVAAGSALVVRGSTTRAITLTGIEPALYFRIVDLGEKIVRGSTRLLGTDILIGTELASDLGVGVGDKLRVTTGAGDAVASSTLTICGVFDLGNKGANQRSTFVALRTAQSLLGLPGGVSSLEVTVSDVYAAETIAQRITAATGVESDSWITTNAQFFTAVSAQTTANTAIRFFVGLSVAFGIASVLAVVVVQKSREIGILRAMGISRAQILRLFLLQGGLLALSGAVLGSGIGALGLILWQRLAKNADGTPLFPLVMDPKLFGAALVLATVTGLVAAFAPARSAARLDPVVAIRG
ncbi:MULTISPECIES: ABC transporter permease [unclassified Variovorax]|jgi:lipoprotein-releasing system permease protein|uniref:ABC transporter permease n=1 Tax=unclassified Variovorax TaxID=663243 RepID=UPI002B229342|nr:MULTISPECIES: ABC transporter permease [unclassified Variovorax]MEB0060069.1 ABC transporter permease [Variovorax sp. LG9.2]MEB0114008.1 ABC transporter permease [Variovorax sp. RTB1]